MDTSPARSQRTYDHRLRDLVRTVRDPDIVAELGVPRSTALGWLRGEYAPVVTAEVLDMDVTRLQAEILMSTSSAQARARVSFWKRSRVRFPANAA